MSIHFDFKGKSGKDLLALNKQWDDLSGFRKHAINDSLDLVSNSGETFGINSAKGGISANMLRVDEMYRLIDGTATGEDRDWGSQRLLGRLLDNAQPVNIGKKLVESRRYSEAGRITRSMSGQTDVLMDKTESNYQKMIVPIFDGGYERDFREAAALQSEMLPALAEDSQEVEFTLLDDVSDYLWNGDDSLVVDGYKWEGIKGDSSIASYTLQVNMTTATQTEVVAELLAVIDTLRINNDKAGPFAAFVSPQIMSHFQTLAASNTNGFMNILSAVRALLPELSSIEVDSKLQGNQLFVTILGQQGLHAKVGMMMSSYQVPRVMHNDPYRFVKWFAAGFQSKNTFSGKKSSVYAA